VIDLAQAAGQAAHHPWWRLAIFIPGSALVGGAAAVVRRIARDRGWFGR
jgi:hypothetical protein